MKKALNSWQSRLMLVGLVGLVVLVSGGLLRSALSIAIGSAAALGAILGIVLLGNRQIWRGFKQLRREVEQDAVLDADQDSNPLLDSFGSDFEYGRRIRRNPARYEAFALRSRSTDIRNAFALAATGGTYGYSQLLQLIRLNQTKLLPIGIDVPIDTWDSSVLCSLARIQANQRSMVNDLENVVFIYSFIEQVFGQSDFSKADRFVYAETLGELERFEEQRDVMRRLGLAKTNPLQVQLAELNAVQGGVRENPLEWLKKLNQIFDHFGMAKVALDADCSKAPLDRLRSTSEAIAGPKVSVIIPTYKGGPLLKTALRSLLEQSWTNLEIIVVDDCSGPEYEQFLNEAEELSPKIQVVRQPVNRGAYVARNAGLAVATGEFVTIHDDDDWSHAEKIALQAEHLLENPDTVANMTLHCRVTEDLKLVRINNAPGFPQPNYSSLMVRRSVFDEIGAWDTVNRGGDSEFYDRLRNFYEQRVPIVGKMPASFTRTWEGSLTSGELGRGYVDPARQLYHWAFRVWHQTAGKDAALLKPQEPRRFPIPSNMRPGYRKVPLGHFDVVFATDFRFPRHDGSVVFSQMEAARRQGLRVGFIQLLSPLADRQENPDPRLYEFQLSGGFSQIGLTDEAEIALLLIHQPSSLTYAENLVSTLIVKRVVIVVDRAPFQKNSLVMEYDIAKVVENTDRLFGQKTLVSPTNWQISEICSMLISDERIVPETLHPVVADIEASIPDFSRIPVVGRHGPDQYVAWPRDIVEFDQAYTSSTYNTVFYGETVRLQRKLGAGALNAKTVLSPELHEINRFLADIDFWVFLCENEPKEPIDGAVAAAMFAGKVVILPPQFESIFGQAALYAQAREVPSIVTSYWTSPEKYLSQADAGRSYAIATYSESSFVQRMNALQSLETIEDAKE